MYALGGKRLTLRLVKYTGKSLWHVKVSVRQVWLVAEEISVSYGYLGENGYKKIQRLSYIPMQTQWVGVIMWTGYESPHTCSLYHTCTRVVGHEIDKVLFPTQWRIQGRCCRDHGTPLLTISCWRALAEHIVHVKRV